MSNETKTVAELRETLQRLKTDLIDDDKLFDHELFKEALSALSTIGKERILELKNDVYDVLECWDDILRSKAIATLGFDTRLGVSKAEFADKAYEIWKNDPSDTVKGTALSVWSGYYIRTNNKEVLIELYRVLQNRTFDIDIRATAYIGIIDVINEKYPDSYEPYKAISELMHTDTAEEFESKVDWYAIHEIMKKYAPEALE